MTGASTESLVLKTVNLGKVSVKPKSNVKTKKDQSSNKKMTGQNS